MARTPKPEELQDVRIPQRFKQIRAVNGGNQYLATISKNIVESNPDILKPFYTQKISGNSIIFESGALPPTQKASKPMESISGYKKQKHLFPTGAEVNMQPE